LKCAARGSLKIQDAKKSPKSPSVVICAKTAEPIEMPFAMDAESEHHVGTIAQLCWAISSQLKHVSTIGKKLVKQQYVLQMSPQYGELRPTSG